jgi:alpha-galactosidase
VASLMGSVAGTRVLSDSFSEDTPKVKIREFPDMPYGTHIAAGSQLLYNTQSKLSFFSGALTSEKWLTVFHLTTSEYTIDDEGTTEYTAAKSLDKKRPQDHIFLKLEVSPGGELDSEELELSTRGDYLQSLREYGEAVRIVDHARVQGAAPWGWWSWTAYYNGVSDGLVNTTAGWLATHLLPFGYNYLHIDEGYDIARGEYITTDPAKFPHGMEDSARDVARHGLTLGLWTAPFEVAEHSWVYQNHKDWLIENEQGEPISIGRLYALDTTNPGAQAYLRETYSTMVHSWGVGYVKLDFMESAAVEGRHFRPNTSAIEAVRIGLRIIRESVGNDVIIDKDGSPMLAPVGIVDTGRLSNDTEHSFKGTFDAATGIAARFYMNRNFYVADPDVFCVSNYRSMDPHWDELKPVTLEEAKAAITLSAMAGGMFEDGDDLPSLGTEPDRLALLTNPDLLKLVRLGRSATPLDLMSYAPDDLQPSLFWIRESQRQGMAAIFNWTDAPRTHDVPLSLLGISGKNWRENEVFSASGASLRSDVIHVEQPAHSVRLIRLVDTGVPVTFPSIAVLSGKAAQVGQPISFQVEGSSTANPLLGYTWDFGDGVSGNGERPQHTFTHPGSYQVHVSAETLDGPTAPATQLIVVDGQLVTR